jgi:hypothetical protein
MPAPLKLKLTETQRSQLVELRDHSKLPYLRERAAALLKIADGHSGFETARNLLNRPHWQDTIYDWVKRFQAEDVKGLTIRSGRGRKPAFSPSVHRQRKSPRSD